MRAVVLSQVDVAVLSAAEVACPVVPEVSEDPAAVRAVNGSRIADLAVLVAPPGVHRHWGAGSITRIYAVPRGYCESVLSWTAAIRELAGVVEIDVSKSRA